MKLKTWHWVVIVIILVVLIIWGITAYGRAQEEKREAELRASQIGSIGAGTQGTGLANILGAIFPFFKTAVDAKK